MAASEPSPAKWMAQVQELRVPFAEAEGRGVAEQRLRLGCLLLLAGDADAAAAAAEAAQMERPHCEEAMAVLGLAEAARGREDLAATLLEVAASSSAVAAWRLAELRAGTAEAAALLANACAGLSLRLQERAAADLLPRACLAVPAFAVDLLLAPAALPVLRSCAAAAAADASLVLPSPTLSVEEEEEEEAQTVPQRVVAVGAGEATGGWPSGGAVDWRAALEVTVLAGGAWQLQEVAAAEAILEAAAATGPAAELALLAHGTVVAAAGGGTAAINKGLRLLHAAAEAEAAANNSSCGEAALETARLLYRVQAAKAVSGSRDPRIGREVRGLALQTLRARPRHSEALRLAATQYFDEAPGQALALLDAAVSAFMSADSAWAFAASKAARDRPLRAHRVRQWIASALSDRGHLVLDLHAASATPLPDLRPLDGFEAAARLWRATCTTISLEEAHDVICIEMASKRHTWTPPEVAAHDLAASVGLIPERSQAFRGLAKAFAAMRRNELAAACAGHARAIDSSSAAQHEFDEVLRPGRVE